MKTGYYVVLQRDHRHVFLAGPFPDEETADKYLPDAVTLAHQQPAWGWFDDHAVLRIEQEYMPPGALNDHLTIDPADLVKEGFSDENKQRMNEHEQHNAMIDEANAFIDAERAAGHEANGRLTAQGVAVEIVRRNFTGFSRSTRIFTGKGN